MRLRNRSVLLVAFLPLVACQGADMPASDPGLSNPPVNAALTLTRFRTDSIAFALNSGVNAPGQLVIRDVTAWSTLWQNIHATTDPMPPLPEVDFGQELIVAAALGMRNTGGYNILLTGANEDAAGVEIQVLETSPGADCFTTQALTQPVDLARASRRDGPVRFVVSQEVRRCGR